MIRVFAEKLRKRIRDRMNELADNAATGTPADWAEYRSTVGEIKGYAESERLLLDLFEEYAAGDTLDGTN